MESLPERRCAAGADSGDSCARRTCRAESGTFAARALHALCVCVCYFCARINSVFVQCVVRGWFVCHVVGWW